MSHPPHPIPPGSTPVPPSHQLTGPSVAVASGAGGGSIWTTSILGGSGTGLTRSIGGTGTGVVVAGASTAIAAYLVYQNFMVREETRLMELVGEGQRLELHGTLMAWRARIKGIGNTILESSVMPHIRSECCDKEELEQCYWGFANGLVIAACRIASADYDRGLNLGVHNQRTGPQMLRYLEATGAVDHESKRLDDCIAEACSGEYWVP